MTNYSDLQLAVIFPKKIENDGSIDGLTEWQDGKRSISSSGKISFYRLFFFKNEYRIHPYWQSRNIIWPTHYKIWHLNTEMDPQTDYVWLERQFL